MTVTSSTYRFEVNRFCQYQGRKKWPLWLRINRLSSLIMEKNIAPAGDSHPFIYLQKHGSQQVRDRAPSLPLTHTLFTCFSVIKIESSWQNRFLCLQCRGFNEIKLANSGSSSLWIKMWKNTIPHITWYPYFSWAPDPFLLGLCTLCCYKSRWRSYPTTFWKAVDFLVHKIKLKSL